MTHPPATRVSFGKLLEGDAKCRVAGCQVSIRVFLHSRAWYQMLCVNSECVIGPRGRTDTPVCPARYRGLTCGQARVPVLPKSGDFMPIFFLDAQARRANGRARYPGAARARADLPDRAAPDPGGMKLLARRASADGVIARFGHSSVSTTSHASRWRRQFAPEGHPSPAFSKVVIRSETNCRARSLRLAPDPARRVHRRRAPILAAP